MTQETSLDIGGQPTSMDEQQLAVDGQTQIGLMALPYRYYRGRGSLYDRNTKSRAGVEEPSSQSRPIRWLCSQRKPDRRRSPRETFTGTPGRECHWTRAQGKEAMLRGITSAVTLLHLLGIARNDISPSNIMVDRNGDARVIDLGAAKPFGERLHECGHVAWNDWFEDVSCTANDAIALKRIRTWLGVD
ncbi:hypothetical protein ANO11243_061640 [Dothideomycetidae sp. 11243]|nr:hypothetical protein ANO11243_061640 [fungal sp. No.11243]